MASSKNHLRQPAAWAITLSQEAAAIATKMLLNTWGGYTVRAYLPPCLLRSQRYIIAGNHQSQLDPFAIFALLPFGRRARLLPLKFMTHPGVYHRWFIKPFAYLLGCYPAHIKNRSYHTYGVTGTVALLRRGYNICIFPEGRRTLRADSDPKAGIVKIMEDFPDAILLLAHLEWTYNKKGKRHVSLIIAPAPPALDKTNPKAVMDAIYAL